MASRVAGISRCMAQGKCIRNSEKPSSKLCRPPRSRSQPMMQHKKKVHRHLAREPSWFVAGSQARRLRSVSFFCCGFPPSALPPSLRLMSPCGLPAAGLTRSLPLISALRACLSAVSRAASRAAWVPGRPHGHGVSFPLSTFPQAQHQKTDSQNTRGIVSPPPRRAKNQKPVPAAPHSILPGPPAE